MTTNTEQIILAKLEEQGKLLARIDAAVLGEDGDGRLPVAERRLNDHAKRLRHLEWYAGIITGIGLVAEFLVSLYHWRK